LLGGLWRHASRRRAHLRFLAIILALSPCMLRCTAIRLQQHACSSRSPGRKLKSKAMPSLISDYMPLVVFILLAVLIGGALLIAPFLVAYRAPDAEKLSPYECGFPPFDDARMRFDARFYLVSLLFIIFDLEVAFLFPWAIVFHNLGALGFWSMMIFLAVLTIGFVYEWNKGALEWD
jgi:NADH-quinone oxidoreductase subunit A